MGDKQTDISSSTATVPSEVTHNLPVRKRVYKTIATQRRASQRLGSRVESVGTSAYKGHVEHYLMVYDLDEFGQPPVFECPCCGRELDDDG